ncbi:hypothetical protein ACROYT_G039869 [Oculina patagonica]
MLAAEQHYENPRKFRKTRYPDQVAGYWSETGKHKNQCFSPDFHWSPWIHLLLQGFMMRLHQEDIGMFTSYKPLDVNW